MESPEVERAVAAARSIASARGLRVDDAVILHNSNRIAVRLEPCKVVARVAPEPFRRGTEFEVAIAQSLAETDCPVALLDPRVEPRVYDHDGFIVTLWTYHEGVSPTDLAPGEYAHALRRMHAGMRAIDTPSPHFTDRVADAQHVVDNSGCSPDLGDADRELLRATLDGMMRAIGRRGPTEQLLHGEPHPGNVMRTNDGLLFVDLETCCRGPVEFDVAHVPEAVADEYPGLDRGLLRECRILMRAMVTTWRWEVDDQLPNGRYWRVEGLRQLRAALEE